MDTGSSSLLSSVETSNRTFLSSFSMTSLSNTCQWAQEQREDPKAREEKKKKTPRTRKQEIVLTIGNRNKLILMIIYFRTDFFFFLEYLTTVASHSFGSTS